MKYSYVIDKSVEKPIDVIVGCSCALQLRFVRSVGRRRQHRCGQSIIEYPKMLVVDKNILSTFNLVIYVHITNEENVFKNYLATYIQK